MKTNKKKNSIRQGGGVPHDPSEILPKTKKEEKDPKPPRQGPPIKEPPSIPSETPPVDEPSSPPSPMNRSGKYVYFI